MRMEMVEAGLLKGRGTKRKGRQLGGNKREKKTKRATWTERRASRSRKGKTKTKPMTKTQPSFFASFLH